MRQLARVLIGGATAELVAVAGLIVAVVCLFEPGISTAGGQAGAGVGAFMAVGGAIADAWTQAAERKAAGQVTAAQLAAKAAAASASATAAAGDLLAGLGDIMGGTAGPPSGSMPTQPAAPPPFPTRGP
jgi:hypothetical protein